MWTFSGILKGFLIQNEVDRTKELVIAVDASATTGTRTTLLAAQTANRTILLPDGNATLVSTSATQTLTNKTIDGDDNTLQDIGISSLKTNLSAASTFISRDASGVVISTKAVPAGVVVGTTDTQALSNKTIDGDLNTVQDLPITALKTDLSAASTFISRDASGVPISSKAVPAGVVVGTTDTQTLTNKVLSGNTAATLINGSGTLALNSSGTVTVPNATDTLVGKATTDILSNKSFPSLVLNGSTSGTATVQAAATTSSYSVVLPSAQGGANTTLSNDGSGNLSWGSVLTNPMSTGGDIIYGGVSGVPTRLANGSLGQALKSSGSTSAPVWAAPTINIQTFFSDGSFVTPSNTTTATNFKVTVCGGGGGGGVGSGSVGGGGGGAGSTSVFYVTNQAPGSTLTVTVGVGGASRSTSGIGNAGGGSSVSGTGFTTIVGGGGGGGLTNAGGCLGGLGGSSSGGYYYIVGQPGGGGYTVAGVGNMGGNGGNSAFGGGGRGGFSTNPGSNGIYGGGGGGSQSGIASGAGDNGVVVIEWVSI